MSTLAELSGSRELLANLTLRELRGKYKRSVLGWGWSLVNPLVSMLIFSFVFGLVLKATPPAGNPSGLTSFPLYLLVGLLPWNFLASSIQGSMAALTSNAGLVKKVWFPREVLVAASVLSWDVSLAIELGVLLVALLVVGNMVLPWLPLLVVLMLLQTAFVFGVGLALAVLNVYFRDVQHFIGIFLQVWFYATPIVYSARLIHHTYAVGGVTVPVKALYDANPMTAFVEAYHRVLFDLTWPTWQQAVLMVGWSALALAVGAATFRRFEPRLAEEL